MHHNKNNNIRKDHDLDCKRLLVLHYSFIAQYTMVEPGKKNYSNSWLVLMVNVMIVWMMCWTMSPSSDRHRKWVKYFLKKIRRLKAEKIVWRTTGRITKFGWCLSTVLIAGSLNHSIRNGKIEIIILTYSTKQEYLTNLRLTSLSRDFFGWMGRLGPGPMMLKSSLKLGLLAKFVDIGKNGIGDKGYNGERYRYVISTSVFHAFQLAVFNIISKKFLRIWSLPLDISFMREVRNMVIVAINIEGFLIIRCSIVQLQNLFSEKA
jgi:hypothetical protein